MMNRFSAMMAGRILRGPAAAGHLSMRDTHNLPHPEAPPQAASKGAARTSALGVLLLLSLTLAACGVRGDPEAPPDFHQAQ